ncbi:MAG TPA: RdgB/HAM1 family non-canonical purine NTP pyrophosphatase [Rhizomicrobium sp.]
MKPSQQLVVASHNAGKLREIFALVAPLGFVVRGAAELGLPEPEETGSTFAENAILKARAAADATGLPALADDSGLVVSALNGAPGIYSARWAGPDRNFDDAIARVERELKNTPSEDRTAKFVCALALVEPEHDVHVFEGEVKGRLSFPPRGTNGFGYDPVFIADGMEKTFGEIEPEHKHAISHRAHAFAKLVQYVLSRCEKESGMATR